LHMDNLDAALQKAEQVRDLYPCDREARELHRRIRIARIRQRIADYLSRLPRLRR
jgi:hypothetical protein